MSEEKPDSVEILVDDFSGGIGVAPEPIVLTRKGKKAYRIKKRKA